MMIMDTLVYMLSLSLSWRIPTALPIVCSHACASIKRNGQLSLSHTAAVLALENALYCTSLAGIVVPSGMLASVVVFVSALSPTKTSLVYCLFRLRVLFSFGHKFL